jgi:hypothetical protein
MHKSFEYLKFMRIVNERQTKEITALTTITGYMTLISMEFR